MRGFVVGVVVDDDGDRDDEKSKGEETVAEG